jgi:DNA-binding XRE family transcriptional regulator
MGHHAAEYGANAVSVNIFFVDLSGVSKLEPVSPWLKRLGNNVRRERTAKGLSQQQLAELADLNIRNVQRIEAGEIDVLLSTAVRLRKALACPWERLIPKEDT